MQKKPKHLLTYLLVTAILLTNLSAHAVGQVELPNEVEVELGDFKFDPETGTITEYTGDAKNLIIPDQINGVDVKIIGKHAFFRKKFESLLLPSKLEKINNSAFGYCRNLKKVEFPNTLKEVGERAFESNTSLEDLKLNEGLQLINVRAFYDCKSLNEQLEVPSTVREIRRQAFKESSISRLYIKGDRNTEKIYLGPEISILKSIEFENISKRAQVDYQLLSWLRPPVQKIRLSQQDVSIKEEDLDQWLEDNFLIESGRSYIKIITAGSKYTFEEGKWIWNKENFKEDGEFSLIARFVLGPAKDIEGYETYTGEIKGNMEILELKLKNSQTDPNEEDKDTESNDGNLDIDKDDKEIIEEPDKDGNENEEIEIPDKDDTGENEDPEKENPNKEPGSEEDPEKDANENEEIEIPDKDDTVENGDPEKENSNKEPGNDGDPEKDDNENEELEVPDKDDTVENEDTEKENPNKESGSEEEPDKGDNESEEIETPDKDDTGENEDTEKEDPNKDPGSGKDPDKDSSETHPNESPNSDKLDSGKEDQTEIKQNPRPEKPSKLEDKKDFTSKEDLLEIKTNRTYGDNRIETAVSLSEKNFTEADTVIIASSENYADALAAASLAGLHKGPILLTDRAGLRDSVTDEIERLGAKKVIVVGGERSVSEEILMDLNKLAPTQRIAGSDRYETSLLIAKIVAEEEKAHELILASGEIFADALAVSSYSSMVKIPVVLAQAEKLPDQLIGTIQDIGVEKITIIGGQASLPDEIFDDLNLETNRIAGMDRYKTSLLIAEKFYKDPSKAYLVSGEVFADSLTAGPIGGKNCLPVILTRKDEASKDLVSYIKSKEIGELEIIGGPMTLGQSYDFD